MGKPRKFPSRKESDVLPTQPAGYRMLSHQEWEEASVSGLTVAGFQNRIPNPAARDSSGESSKHAEIPLTGASLRTPRIPGLDGPCGTSRLIWPAWWSSVLHCHGKMKVLWASA